MNECPICGLGAPGTPPCPMGGGVAETPGVIVRLFHRVAWALWELATEPCDPSRGRYR